MAGSKAQGFLVLSLPSYFLLDSNKSSMGGHRLCKYLPFHYRVSEIPSSIRQYHPASQEITLQILFCPLGVRGISFKALF